MMKSLRQGAHISASPNGQIYKKSISVNYADNVGRSTISDSGITTLMKCYPD